MCYSCSCNSKAKRISQMIQNQNLLQLRLSSQEKVYYTNLFYNFAINDAVYIETFPKLLGVFGTDIADGFAKRIFEIFSSNPEHITLFEYLKYIDVYHYGDEIERCKVTCKLMDTSNNGKITLQNFTLYINLIIGAVMKVNPGLKKDLFTEEDISLLFYKISKNKDFFSYDDFESIYHEKPELLSWIDYFKNDSNDTLLIVHTYFKKVIKILLNFTGEFMMFLKKIRKGNGYNGKNTNDSIIVDLREKIQKFKSEIDGYDKKFINYANCNRFNMRNVFEKIQKNQNDDSDYSQEDSDHEDSFEIEKINEEKEQKNISNFFNQIKKKLNSINNDTDIQPPVSDSEDDFSSIMKGSSKSENANSKDNDDDDCDSISDEDNDEYLSNINKLKSNNSKQFAFFPSSIVSTSKLKEKKSKIPSQVIKSFEYISYKLFKTLLNCNDCYIWIEKNYLKSPLTTMIKTKREENKKKSFNQSKSKQILETEPKINIVNIPKNKLKASDYSFKILLNMIMGIQIAVEATPNITNISKISQYMNSMTYSIQTINFGEDKQEVFLLKEFAGIIFNNIRKICGFDKDKFIHSISPQDFITEMIISSSTIIEELCSTGSSGSLFYYTRDGKFILKTISKDEYKTIKRILPSYYKHLMIYPKSLLPKYLGCYKLIKKVKKKMSNVYFIIMMNIFRTPKDIHLRFDLKGSTIGRQVLKNDAKEKDIKELYGKYSYAFKDLDLERFNKLFFFSKTQKSNILTQLLQDSIFLKDCNLNDYSLLIGIHKPNFNSAYINDIELEEIPPSKEPIKNGGELLTETDEYIEDEKTETNCEVLNDGGVYSEDRDEIYYFGIIDILTNYNFVKKMEYALKTVRYFSHQMSCVPPSDYQERFIQYMRRKILCKEDITNSNNNMVTN